jgi:outer membrane immunogenic protein
LTNPNYFNTLGPVELGSKFHMHSQGFVGGGALGYNLQYQWFVAGLEVGALFMDIHQKRKSPFFPESDLYSYRTNCLVTAKARLGYSYKGLLPYITGGWAGGNVKLKLDDRSSDTVAHSTKWANGWTVGAGADLRILHHWSVGLAYDYIHMSYDKDKLSCRLCGAGVGHGSPTVKAHLQTQLLTARINFHL